MKKILSILYGYIAFVGLFTFAVFIMQESIQMLTFASFTTTKTERWDIAKNNLDRMVKINNHIKYLNKYFLWIQPFQFVSYSDFSEAADGYIDSQRHLIMANAPEVFMSEVVAIQFYYRQVAQYNGYTVVKAGKLQFRIASLPLCNPINITGKITKITENLYEIQALN